MTDPATDADTVAGACPACETTGEHEAMLAPGQHWCPNDDCRVRTFMDTTTSARLAQVHADADEAGADDTATTGGDGA